MNNSKKLKICCKMMEYFLFFSVVFIPVLGQVRAWLPNDTVIQGFHISTDCQSVFNSELSRFTQAVIFLCSDMIVSFLLCQLYLLFKSIRVRGVFNFFQVKRIYITGGCFIILAVYHLATDMIMSLYHAKAGEVEVYIDLNNIIYIPIGIGLFILAFVLKIANALQEEQELVI
ncbi:DUF2975 domain-containing protein [Pantoea sp. 1.19]|uniref:DUF2975 domain-containing protein n=1 Tax=Pantoea sp. 1.19 TaxID=1925589 RepID=UPI0009491C5C|nr:DUF2975 domain-containing protein [Pantoea sp. 1.19]